MRIETLFPTLRQGLLAAMRGAPAGPAANDAAATQAGATAAATGAEARAQASAAMATPTTSVAVLVALAAMDPRHERRRRAIAEAERGLGLLEALHHDALAGAVPRERLDALAEWARTFTPPEDPALAPLAREIELRVRVELAKHDLIV